MPERDKFTPKPDLPLGKYRHYKGGEYEVIALACDEATHEWLVIYKALYDTGEMPSIWARTYDNFVETVDIPTGRTARFITMSGLGTSLDIKANYLTRIESSVGTTMFQHLYIRSEDGASTDVTNGGELSCAQHVSSVLALVSLIDRPHATVASTLRAMKRMGWHETNQPAPGAVVHWPAGKAGNEHIGFWLAPQKVISNSARLRVPVVHSKTLSDGREPVAYYTHDIVQ